MNKFKDFPNENAWVEVKDGKVTICCNIMTKRLETTAEAKEWSKQNIKLDAGTEIDTYILSL